MDESVLKYALHLGTSLLKGACEQSECLFRLGRVTGRNSLFCFVFFDVFVQFDFGANNGLFQPAALSLTYLFRYRTHSNT